MLAPGPTGPPHNRAGDAQDSQPDGAKAVHEPATCAREKVIVEIGQSFDRSRFARHAFAHELARVRVEDLVDSPLPSPHANLSRLRRIVRDYQLRHRPKREGTLGIRHELLTGTARTGRHDARHRRQETPDLTAKDDGAAGH